MINIKDGATPTSWQYAFAERHEFDVYPDHFMTGMRNEFAAGWYAALKAAASMPRMDTATKPCECRKCLEGKSINTGFGEVPIAMTRMIVCRECGNKRCPHANDHRNACTNSNEPGQIGSAYPGAPEKTS